MPQRWRRDASGETRTKSDRHRFQFFPCTALSEMLPVKTWELGASKVLGLIGAQYMVAKATMQTLGLLHS
jgi:hypothetical protein